MVHLYVPRGERHRYKSCPQGADCSGRGYMSFWDGHPNNGAKNRVRYSRQFTFVQNTIHDPNKRNFQILKRRGACQCNISFYWLPARDPGTGNDAESFYQLWQYPPSSNFPCLWNFDDSALHLFNTDTSLKQGRVRDFFFTLDRIAIYLLIAGTYTPLALVAIGGVLGWTIFGIEWGCALLGTVLILRKPDNFEKGVNLFFVISYAVMGWLVLIAIVPLINILPLMGWLLILIGGSFLYHRYLFL